MSYYSTVKLTHSPVEGEGHHLRQRLECTKVASEAGRGVWRRWAWFLAEGRAAQQVWVSSLRGRLSPSGLSLEGRSSSLLFGTVLTSI